MSSPSDLNEFALAMDKATEIYKKLTICEALVRYLKNPNSDLSLEEHGPFCLNLIQWMTSPSLKISLKALEAALEVLNRMPQVFKPYVTNCFPALIERYADSKEQVRNTVHQVVMAFVEKDILTPQGLHGKLLQYGYLHKNSVVRVESLKCLNNILVQYGAKSLQLSGATQVFLKLYADQSEIVREEASNILVEIYRQVGEKLRQNINKSFADEVPAQRLAALYAKFDIVRDPSLKMFQNPSGDSTLSRPNSVEDFADGTTTRRMVQPSKIPSATQSRGASMEDLTKKQAAETRRGYGTLGSVRKAPRPSIAANVAAGAVDESSFRAAFLDVPAVQLYAASDLRDMMKTIATTIGNADEDWNKRVEAFRKIRSVCIAAGNYPEFPELMKKLEIPIMDALKDLRSQVVREACITIAFLSERMKAKFTYFAEFVFPSLVLLIQNSAKIMSSSALVTVRFIVENTSSLRLISLVVNSLASKSKDIRRAMCEILLIILSTWPVLTLEKKHPEIRLALQKGIGDADPEARQLARKAYCEYKTKFPERADELLRSLDASYRRMLSEGSTESVNLITPSRNTIAKLRKSPASAERTPVFKRSNTAVDPQAVQRASVRAQYAAMNRIKAGGSATGRPPTAMPSSMANSSVGLIDDSSNRSRARAPRYSRSQPTSRSASPCAQFNYQTFQTPGSATIGRSGIPRSNASSRDASRETSPTRLGAIPKDRYRKRLIGLGQQTPSLPLTRPALSHKMLQETREAEYAVANAFIRNETDGPYRSLSGEKSSDESETSSLCDRSSCGNASATPFLMNIRDIMESLNKSDWSDRKLGLMSLRNYLIDHTLTLDELRRVTDSLTRMFMDSQTKVYTLFLDTLSLLINRHCPHLEFWLYTLIHKLFTKLGTDVLPTIEKKILNSLSLIRDTFPFESQVRDTFRFIVDPHHMHNTKVRLHILKHLSLLATMVSKSQSSIRLTEVSVKDHTAAVLSRLVKWSEVAELKEAATKCIADLFYMNAPLISNAMPQLTPEEQLVVDHIVKTSLKPFSHTSKNSESDQVYKSLQMTSQEIQTYRFDGSQDSGICPMTPNSPTLSRYNIEERLANLSTRSTPVKNAISSPTETQDNHNSSSNVSYASNNGSDEWAEILDTLRPESTKSIKEKVKAMNDLLNIVKPASSETLSPYVVKLIKRLLFILTSLEDHAATATESELTLLQGALYCLDKMIHKKGLEAQFSQFYELLALKTFKVVQNRSYGRIARSLAEFLVQSMAQLFPVMPLLTIFHNISLTFDKSVDGAYHAIKGIQEIVQSHPKEEFDPGFNSTMTVLLMAFDSDYSAIRKAVVFCLVALHFVYSEAEMAPYLRKLDSSKKKLLDVYIQRQSKENK